MLMITIEKCPDCVKIVINTLKFAQKLMTLRQFWSDFVKYQAVTCTYMYMYIISP